MGHREEMVLMKEAFNIDRAVYRSTIFILFIILVALIAIQRGINNRYQEWLDITNKDLIGMRELYEDSIKKKDDEFFEKVQKLKQVQHFKDVPLDICRYVVKTSKVNTGYIVYNAPVDKNCSPDAYSCTAPLVNEVDKYCFDNGAVK